MVNTDPATDTTTDTLHDTSTGARVRLLALALATTAVAATLGGLWWPEASGGGETYTYPDIAPVRDLWWALLNGLAVLAVINVPLQALTVMWLTRARGSGWATAGAALMWLGIGLQSTGVAGWASAYFYATDPTIDRDVSTAVIEAANADQAHLFGLLASGALLVVLGTALQSVGLWRARVVPRWIPLVLLCSLFSLVIPGDGLLGLVTAVPMAAGALGLAYAAWRHDDTDA